MSKVISAEWTQVPTSVHGVHPSPRTWRHHSGAGISGADTAVLCLRKTLSSVPLAFALGFDYELLPAQGLSESPLTHLCECSCLDLSAYTSVLPPLAPDSPLLDSEPGLLSSPGISPAHLKQIVFPKSGLHIRVWCSLRWKPTFEVRQTGWDVERRVRLDTVARMEHRDVDLLKVLEPPYSQGCTL